MKRNRILSFLLTGLMVFALFGYFPDTKESAVSTLTSHAANVENIVERADYLYGIKWTPLTSIYSYGQQSTFSAGKSYRLPYGMPVNTGTFIGYDISVEDFIAQTKKSSSKLYTSSSGWSGSSYSSAWYCPYYSMDCSTFVSWCWGLSSRQTTYGLENYGTYIGACTKANASKLQLGDALNSSDHVGLVTGISDGKYEVTEMTPPVLYRKTYTASELAAEWSGYNILRPTNSKTNTVKVNYHTNGGTIATNDTYSAKDGMIYNKERETLAVQTWVSGSGREKGLLNPSTFKLSRKGYTFTGWSTSKSGGKLFDPDDTSLTANDIYPDIATKSGTVTLYAQWELNLLTMNYNTNGGQISDNETYYAETNGNIYKKSDSKVFSVKWGYTYEAEKGLYDASTFNLTRPGYKFLGWSLSKTGGTVYSQSDNTIRAATLFPDIYTKSGTVTLYAQWELNLLTMNYNTNGGQISDNETYYAETNGNIYKKSDSKVFSVKWGYTYEAEKGLYDASTFNLTRPGYKFLGWSLSKTGGTVYSQSDNTIRAATLFPDIYTKSGKVMLYAQWKKVAIKGDINVDGAFNVTDVVLLQKWLLGVSDATLKDWQAADLNKDNRLDAFDLCIVKHELLNKK